MPEFIGAPTLDRETSWLKSAMKATGDVAYHWDLVADRIAWVGASAELFGVVPPTTGDAFNALINPRDKPSRMTALSDHFSAGRPYECDYRLSQPDGSTVWIHDRGQAQFNRAGKAVSMVGTLRRVTDLKLRQQALEQSLEHDRLTGRLSRIRLTEAAERALEWAKRTEGEAAFLAIGVDRMSMVNNAFGSDTGDAILIGVAERLAARIDGERLGRLGADRFGAVLLNCDAEEARQIALELLASVRSAPFTTPSGALHATVSIGGVLFPQASMTAAELMARAESALHAAKREGRDRYIAHGVNGPEQARQRLALGIGEQVRQALRQDQLVLAYQPVVEVKTGRVAHYECLLRILGPRGEPKPAYHFMPAIEEMGLSHTIDMHVLDLALKQLSEHPGVELAVNISGLTAGERRWVDILAERLEGHAGVGGRLTVEITETAALKDIEETARLISAVRTFGCRVALDDFGAGYTSFRQLHMLTVDAIKIDGSFIRTIEQRPEAQTIVRTLVGIGEAFNLQTVAECIETPAEARVLTELGVPYLQGFLYGRPSLERPWMLQTPDTAGFAPDWSRQSVVPLAEARVARNAS
ncbi:MAG TPA: GGDEF and EAL domain-containing protein [Alphaproteobacteria bacterium]|nr:GGDEF and EAL domain-containing protein [Alphaproteobacteria bacterium]